jgi:hypothetical protein
MVRRRATWVEQVIAIATVVRGSSSHAPLGAPQTHQDGAEHVLTKAGPLRRAERPRRHGGLANVLPCSAAALARTLLQRLPVRGFREVVQHGGIDHGLSPVSAPMEASRWRRRRFTH